MSLVLLHPFSLPIFPVVFIALHRHGVRKSQKQRERGGTIDRVGLCRVLEGGQTIGHEKVALQWSLWSGGR